MRWRLASPKSNNVFNGNAATFSGYQNLAVNSAVTKTGSTLTNTVTYSADVPVTFMKIAGWNTMHITGTSNSSSSLPLYLDFYLMLDVSGSMGLPSTPAEAVRMQTINPDNYVQYPTGCTLACHFAPQNSACTNGGTQRYPTNNYCMGYLYSRVSQSALSTLVSSASTVSRPKSNVPGLPNAMLTNLNNAVDGSPNSFLTGNANSLSYSLTAVSSCSTDGTDSCIQLRLDAVGYAVNQLFATRQHEGGRHQPVPDRPLPLHSVSLQLFPADQQYQWLDDRIRRRSTTPPPIWRRCWTPI